MSLDSYKIIKIDEGLTEIEKQHVCGYELGHFLFHGEANFVEQAASTQQINAMMNQADEKISEVLNYSKTTYLSLRF